MHTCIYIKPEKPKDEDTLTVNATIGELITREKYQFVDSKLIASIVKDTIKCLQIFEEEEKQ